MPELLFYQGHALPSMVHFRPVGFHGRIRAGASFELSDSRVPSSDLTT